MPFKHMFIFLSQVCLHSPRLCLDQLFVVLIVTNREVVECSLVDKQCNKNIHNMIKESFLSPFFIVLILIYL